MNDPLKMMDQELSAYAEARRYRRAFRITLFVAALFALAGAGVWWRFDRKQPAMQPQAASQSASVTTNQVQTEMPGMAGQAPTPQQAEAPIVPIQLSPQRMQSIGVQLGEVGYKPVNDEIRFYGNVQVNERRLAYVQTRFAGWIRKVYVDATGDFVRKGQPLFTVYSPDLVTTEQEYLLAKQNAHAVQQSTVSGVASAASSLLDSARQRLLQWEISPNEIDKLDQTGKAITDLTIYAPVSGYVTEKNALANLYVQPETRLYTVADLSEIWVMAQIFQNDAGKVKPGDPAEVTVDAYPNIVFHGRVDYVLPQLDMTTRTLPVRLVFPNPGLKLRPGMYVNVRVKLPLGRQMVVPASAVFHSGTRNLVFVNRGGGQIEPREIELGPAVGDQVVIRKGVKPNTQIVTSANFLIDSEAQLQAAAGAFMPPPPGAGAAASMNAPASAQATIALTTDPTPPHKGSNTVRVRVTSQDGKAIAGANVTVTFFMPAMPAMGMAAMKTVIHAADKGGGMYEGSGDLGSGGTWQVSITATLNGQIIANKQMTMNATGGM